MHTGACGIQKRVLGPLELELQVVVSHPNTGTDWEKNSGPLQDQEAVFVTESTLIPKLVLLQGGIQT